MFPTELQSPPPRDARAAGALVAKTRTRVMAGVVLAIVLPPICIFGVWILRGFGGSGDVMLAAIIAGIVALVFILVAVSAYFQGQRSVQLYRDGVLTMGHIQGMNAVGNRGASNLGVLNIQYQDAQGQTHNAKFATTQRQLDFDTSPGAAVPVLYLPSEPQKCAIYTQGTGLIAGTGRG